MKKIIFFLGFIIFSFSLSTAQITGGGGHQSKNETGSINVGKHTLLFDAAIPWAPFGIKYAYIDKFGGYASICTDFGTIDEDCILTFGPTFQLTPKIHLYFGAGYIFGWGGAALEAGLIFRINGFSIDAGFCANFEEFEDSPLKLGFGIIF